MDAEKDFSPDAVRPANLVWGMQQDEADDQKHLQPLRLTCAFILIDTQDNDNRVGLLYVDTTQADCLRINPPSSSSPVREAAAARLYKRRGGGRYCAVGC